MWATYEVLTENKEENHRRKPPERYNSKIMKLQQQNNKITSSKIIKSRSKITKFAISKMELACFSRTYEIWPPQQTMSLAGVGVGLL